MKRQLLFLFAFFSLYIMNAQTPGVSIFYEQTAGDSREYIEYIPGNLPIIISAPHGGVKLSGQTIGGVSYPDNDSSLPDRNCGTNERDDNTEILVREIQAEIFALTGCYAHVIINNLHRSKLDPNRDQSEATCGNANATDHWNAFHNYIDQASTAVEADWGKGLYIDLHGQSHSVPRIEAGYNISAGELNNSDLNATSIINQSTIKNLVNTNLNNETHEQLVRGNNSLGELFQNAAGTFYAAQNYPGCGQNGTNGYRAVPSNTNNGGGNCDDTRPNGNAYFDGDFYNNRRHGSGSGTTGGTGGGGNIDGIMTEVNRRVRDLGTYNGNVFDTRPQTLVPFAKDYAAVVLEYIDTHYNDFATFNYAAAVYNISEANPTPNLSGIAGGTYSSSAGIALNTLTGEIDLSNSSAGTYTITYTVGTCSYYNSAQQIEITDGVLDTEAPTAPTNLSAANTTETTTTLSWNAATDNVAVTGYNVYQNSNLITSVGTTSYQVSGLNDNTTYSFYVEARDAQGNTSPASNTIAVTTLEQVIVGCSGGITTFPYTEGFENTLGAWTQSNNDDIDWTVDANGTPSNNTGPSSATQGTYYIYVEASGNGTGFPNKRAIVTSPCYDLSNYSAATFSFAYHMFGSNNMGSIDLEVSNDDGASWTSLWNETGNQGNNWLTAAIDLTAFAGNNIQLRFNRITGSTWQADIAIDDVQLTASGIPDTTIPVITLTGDAVIDLLVGDTYTELGATAIDNIDGDITASIVTAGNVDATIAGSYTITYNVSDAAGNAAAEVSRTINVTTPVDDTAPIITLNGSPSQDLFVGQTYTEQGATATDTVDGDITNNIIISGTVNTAIAGIYTITYNVSDAAGNAAIEVSRIVTVTADITAPVITLNGNAFIDLFVGDTYTEQGAIATDNADGNLTANIIVVGSVDTATVGIYTVTYNVSDTAGNVAIEVVRTIEVSLPPDTIAPVIILNGASVIDVLLGDTYTELGATATDNVDGDLTSSISIAGTVNTAIAGNYNITYNVSDAAGNPAVEETRIVNVNLPPDVIVPVITLLGSATVDLFVGDTYTESGATATDNVDGNLTPNIIIAGTVNTAVAGTYTVTYNVSDAAGNAADEVSRIINVATPPDTTAPVIELNGSPTIDLFVNQTYTEQGATATDNVDGDLTASIVTSGTVNTAIAGTYIITYNVSDVAGNAATEVSRTITVVEDTTAPIITLNGDATINLIEGGSYTDQGATASDNQDGDITANIVTAGSVDTTIAATYFITYNVSDAAGNTATEITRTVIVEKISGCTSGISSFPYSEGFENTLGAWTQSNADDIDWTVDANGTPSGNTGPSSASEGAYYIYVEASGSAGFPTKQAIINSPCFDLSSLSEATFSFKYHMFGSNDMGSINLELSNDNGATWNSIWNKTGNQGNSWQTAIIDLTAYVGGGIQLRFNRITGGTWQADIAIDDVSLIEGAVVVNSCSGGVTAYPYAEGYENTLGDWTQSSGDDIDWTIDANGTPSNNTGPSNATEGSSYIYVEASGNGTGFPNKQAIINSPCYDLTNESSATFNFSYHMFGSSDMGTIALEASNDSGVSWTTLWTESGNKGNTWLTTSIDLSSYLGDSVQLRFNRITGGTWQADIALDNVNLITASSARNSVVTQTPLAIESLKMYPNPVTEVLHIALTPPQSSYSYRITNMYGQELKNGTTRKSIAISTLPSGVYYIEVLGSKGRLVQQFIKK